MVTVLETDDESLNTVNSFRFLYVLAAGELTTVVVVAVVIAAILVRPGVIVPLVLSIQVE